MKFSRVIFAIFFLMLFIQSVRASNYYNDVSWSTGTEIRFIARIDSTSLEIGWYDVDLIITLQEKNPDALWVAIRKVDYRVSSHYSSYYEFPSTAAIDEPGYSQVAIIDFLYSTDWGEVDFEMKFTIREVYDSSPSKTLYTDWLVYFRIFPYYEETPSPNTPSVNDTVEETSFSIATLLVLPIFIHMRKKKNKQII